MCNQEMVATRRMLAVTKTLAELLKPRSKLPLRVHVNAVRVLAVGKIIDAAKSCVYAEGGVVRKCKGKGKGKGDVESTRRVNIYVMEAESGTLMWLCWKIDGITINDIENKLVDISNAKPVINRGGLFLDLDRSSDIVVRFDPMQVPVQITQQVTLWSVADVAEELIGSFVNMVLFVEEVQPKGKADSGDDYIQLVVMDTDNRWMSLLVWDHLESDFKPGSTIIAYGLVVRPGQSFTDGQWHDDMTWGVAKYAGWRTAFSDVGVLV